MLPVGSQLLEKIGVGGCRDVLAELVVSFHEGAQFRELVSGVAQATKSAVSVIISSRKCGGREGSRAESCKERIKQKRVGEHVGRHLVGRKMRGKKVVICRGELGGYEV